MDQEARDRIRGNVDYARQRTRALRANAGRYAYRWSDLAADMNTDPTTLSGLWKEKNGRSIENYLDAMSKALLLRELGMGPRDLPRPHEEFVQDLDNQLAKKLNGEPRYRLDRLCSADRFVQPVQERAFVYLVPDEEEEGPTENPWDRPFVQVAPKSSILLALQLPFPGYVTLLGLRQEGYLVLDGLLKCWNHPLPAGKAMLPEPLRFGKQGYAELWCLATRSKPLDTAHVEKPQIEQIVASQIVDEFTARNTDARRIDKLVFISQELS